MAGATPSAAELRAFMKERLPEYMVPTAFVSLEALPLTSNGKIDRRALPDSSAGRDEEGFVAPRNPTEEMVAAVCAEVLGLERLGVPLKLYTLGPPTDTVQHPAVQRVRASVTEVPARPWPGLERR